MFCAVLCTVQSGIQNCALYWAMGCNIKITIIKCKSWKFGKAMQVTYEIYVFVVVVVLLVLLVFFGISATIPTHRKIQCLTNKDYLLYNILF